MKLLVIIVSYNFEPWLERCLQSLEQSQLPADVLVIDNASQDNTVQRIKSEFPHVRLIESAHNLGFGKANNIGMEIALKEGYDAIFLMNQDSWIDANVLSKLASYSMCNPPFGILSPVHLTGSGDSLDAGFAAYSSLKSLQELSAEEGLIELSFVNAAFWWIPIETVRKVGGFSPLFYHYGEDKDYINRLSYHGYKVGYLSAIFGNHDRAYRTPTEAHFFRSEYVYLLSELANPHYSFARSIAYGFLATGKKAWKSILAGNLKQGVHFLSLATKLLTKVNEATRIRTQVKRVGHHFLN